MVDAVCPHRQSQRPVTPRVQAQTQQLEREQDSALPPPSPVRPFTSQVGACQWTCAPLALSCNVYGTTKALSTLCTQQGHPGELILTRMAAAASPYETNTDLAVLAEDLVVAPSACLFRGFFGSVSLQEI